jgi:two-component system OmpR family response regulator
MNETDLIRVGDIQINTHLMTVQRNRGKPVHLSRRMYDIVVYLAKANGRPVSQMELVTNVFPKPVTPNTAEVYVKYIRDALGKDVISTRTGFGYVLKAAS